MRRRLLLLALAVALAALGALVLRPGPRPSPLPPPYDRLEAALAAGDLDALAALARGPGYAAVVASRALAESGEVEVERRLGYVERVVAALGRRAYLWAAGIYERLGELDRAAGLYRELAGDERALSALERLARRGSREAVRALLRSGHPEAALRYARDPDERGRALLALGRPGEALRLLSSPRERGLALLALGRLAEAEAAFRRAGDRLMLGRVLLREGRLEEAVSALTAAGERGVWEAAGALEARDRARALGLYLELARGGGELAGDAAYRAYVLARRLGDAAARREARGLLGGGHAVLAGLSAGEVRVPPPPARPPGLGLVRDLAAAGRREWARGEALLRAAGSRGEERRAWAWVLDRLGATPDAARYGGEPLAHPTPYREEVFAAARENALDPWLLYAVIKVESAFDPRAVSPSGAKGLLQFTDATWRYVAGRLGEPPADPFDPRAAIRYGAFYLGELLRRFGDVRLAVTAYNGGPGYVARGMERYRDFEDFWRFQPRDEPRRYLVKVLREWSVYRALAGVPRREPGFLAELPGRR